MHFLKFNIFTTRSIPKKYFFIFYPRWPPSTPTKHIIMVLSYGDNAVSICFISCKIHTFLNVQASNTRSIFHSILPHPPQFPLFLVPLTSDMYAFLIIRNICPSPCRTQPKPFQNTLFSPHIHTSRITSCLFSLIISYLVNHPNTSYCP